MSRTTELTGGGGRVLEFISSVQNPRLSFQILALQRSHIQSPQEASARAPLSHTAVSTEAAWSAAQEGMDEHNNKVTRRLLVVGVSMERQVSWIVDL